MSNRKIKNPRELFVCLKYQKLGYNFLKKGWPDFVFYNDKEVIFVEVKRKQKRRTKKMGRSKHQLQMAEIFKRVGLEIKYEYIALPAQSKGSVGDRPK